jgi:hypothetical protein
MAVYSPDSKFLLVVHTNDYTGNFEREFCAYVTGVVGECGKGQNLANEYREDEGEDYHDFWDSLDQVADDNGCRRPVSIYMSINDCKSLVIFFQEDPTDVELEIITRRAPLFFTEHWSKGKVLGIELFKNEVVRKTTLIAKLA